MFLGFVVFVAIVAAFLWYVVTYNHLLAVRERVAQTWSSIDVLLRERHDELPILLDLCAQHLKEEQAALDGVLEARAAIFGARHSSDPDDLGRAESELRRRLGKLLALAQNQSDLAASQPFVLLKQRLAGLEAGISERRDVYNAAVDENNAAIEQFPGNVLAGMGGFRPAKPLDLESGSRSDAKPLLDA
jgi:LemA protein